MKIYKTPNGRLKISNGRSSRLYWSPSKLESLKRKFATTKNEELAVEFEVSLRTLVRKARELGLVKDAEWQHQQTMAHCRIAQAVNLLHPNSGTRMWLEKGKPYRFQPGHEPVNVTPEGRARADRRRVVTMRENLRRQKAGLPKLVMNKRQKMNFYKMMGV